MLDEINNNQSRRVLDRRKTKPSFEKGFFAFSVIVLIILFIIFIMQSTHLQTISKALSYIDLISGNSQRLVKMEIVDEPNDKLIAHLDKILSDLQTGGAQDIFVPDLPRFHRLLDKLVQGWDDLKNEISIVRKLGWDASRILFVSERHFYHTTEIGVRTQEYFNYHSENLKLTQRIIIAMMVVVSFLVIKQMASYIRMIQRNKEMAKVMYIDVHTGVYNKSKCEELFNVPQIFPSTSQSATIVFDVNDLKSVNDRLGHAYGDGMILQFATSLKNAAKKQHVEPFIGRYGGDEFIVFFEKTSEKELLNFLDSIQESVSIFNDSNELYQLSYATGYAFSHDYNGITMKELLAHADKAMYENKIILKKLGKASSKIVNITETPSTT